MKNGKEFYIQLFSWPELAATLNSVIFAVCFFLRVIPIFAKILSSNSTTYSSCQKPQIKNNPKITSTIVSNVKDKLILNPPFI